RKAGPEVGQQLGWRPLDVRKLAAEKQEDAIRILRVDALACSPGPLLISRQSADVCRPILGDVVWAESVLAAHHARNRRHANCIPLPENGGRFARQQKTHQAANAYRYN